MSVARKILLNTFSQIAGKAAIALLGIVSIKIITTYLGKCGYGEYTAAFEFLAFFAIVADMGLFTIGIREMAKDDQKIPIIIGNILTIRTFLSVVVVSIAVITAFILPQYEGSKIPLAVGIVGLGAILNILTSTVSTVLQVHLKMQYNSLASVIGKIFTVGYMAFIIYVLHPGNYDSGFYQLIWAGIFGNSTMLGVTFYYSSKLTHIRYRFDKAFLKDVIIKALPYGIALVLNTLYFRIGSVLLSLIGSKTQVINECGEASNYGEVAIYGVPMRMLEAVGIIPVYFMNAVLPVLTKALNAKNGSHKRIIQYAFDFLVMGSLPIVAGTLVLAYPLIAVVSTPEFLSNLSKGFYGADIVLQILIFASAFSFINSLFGFLLVADNRQMSLLKRNAIGAILTIGADLILIPHFGARGAAITNVITEGYVMVASYLIAKHYINFQINLKSTFKMALSSIVMGIVIFFLRDPTFYYLQNKNIILLVPVGAVVYIGMLFFTKTLSKEMLGLLKKPSLPSDIESV